MSKFGRDAEWWLRRQYPEIHRRLEKTGWLETAIRELDQKAGQRFYDQTHREINPLPEEEAERRTLREVVYITTPDTVDRKGRTVPGNPIWAMAALSEMERSENTLMGF